MPESSKNVVCPTAVPYCYYGSYGYATINGRASNIAREINKDINAEES